MQTTIMYGKWFDFLRRTRKKNIYNWEINSTCRLINLNKSNQTWNTDQKKRNPEIKKNQKVVKRKRNTKKGIERDNKNTLDLMMILEMKIAFKQRRIGPRRLIPLSDLVRTRGWWYKHMMMIKNRSKGKSRER